MLKKNNRIGRVIAIAAFAALASGCTKKTADESKQTEPTTFKAQALIRSRSRCSRKGLVQALSATTIGHSSAFPWLHRRSRARSSFRPPHQRSSPAKPPMLLSPVARRFASNEEGRSSPSSRVARQWARASFSCHSFGSKGTCSVRAGLPRCNSHICSVGVVPCASRDSSAWCVHRAQPSRPKPMSGAMTPDTPRWRRNYPSLALGSQDGSLASSALRFKASLQCVALVSLVAPQLD